MAGITDALRRMGGMYGAAYRATVSPDGKTAYSIIAEAVEVTGAVEINRVEVPLVGTTKQGYKPGRESREGTLRVQKIDSSWEIEIYKFLSASLTARRAVRGTAQATLRTFDLLLQIDDPEAYDYEAWLLENCQIWRLPLGFSITDDIVDREFPITWESEQPVHVFRVNADGVPIEWTSASEA